MELSEALETLSPREETRLHLRPVLSLSLLPFALCHSREPVRRAGVNSATSDRMFRISTLRLPSA